MILLIQQLFLIILFLIFTLTCFTLVGFFLLKILKVNKEDLIETYLLSTVLGLVLFTLVAYMLAFLNLRFLIWFFPALGIYSLFLYKYELKKLRLGLSKKNIVFFFLILITGVISQVLVNAPSGLPYQDGLYFWSSHGRDGIWHLALMEEMHKSVFPFQNPVFAGYRLQNYHFFVDLLMSEVTRLVPFYSLDVYFRFVPVLFSILLGLSSFILARLWVNSRTAGIWAMFFTYFVGSFGYIVIFLRNGNIFGGETVFWINQPHSVVGNPPQAAAFIILLTFIVLFLRYLQSYKDAYLILLILLGGVIAGFKVYAGMVLLITLFLTGLYAALFNKNYKILMTWIGISVLSLCVLIPNSSSSTKFVIFEPWWFIRTMVVDKLGLIDWEHKRQHYLSVGRLTSYLRILQLEIISFFIFLLGNLGTRSLGFLKFIKIFKRGIKGDLFSLFFISFTCISFLIPLFFLQRGVVYNSIQFAQYFLLLFGLLSAIAVTEFMRKLKNLYLRIILSVIIVVFSVPTQIGLLWQFYSNPALSKITYQELDALNFLRSQSGEDAVILTAPFNKYEKAKYKDPPIPIYAWYDTGYVSAFSAKQSLIADEEQITIMGYDVNALSKAREEIFQTADVKLINEFLKKYGVDYIYLAWDQKFATDSATINMDLAFENKDTRVYKVRK